MCTVEALHEDIRYAFSCIDTYLRYFPRNRIRNAHICEIGPGKNLAVTLTLRSLGAERVYAVDKYLKPWDDSYHPALCSALAEAVAARWPDADLSVFHRCVPHGGHDVDGVFPLAEDAERLDSIPNGSVDFLCSWAVLEHLYHPPQAFARFAEIVRHGGCGVHQVDFRDHCDFDNPLEFLLHHYRWNEEPEPATFAWMARRMGRSVEQARAEGIDANGLIRRVCGYNGNSYRHLDYDDLWRANGFDIVRNEHNMHADIAYLDDFIPRLTHANVPCRSLPRNALNVLSALYAVEKRHE